MKLLGAITTLFTPITAFDMPKELIAQIAGESEESQSRREQLNKKLWILGKGSDTCKRFVGIRGLGKRSQPHSIPLLTVSVDSEDEMQASLQNNRATSPSSSCNSVDGINSEPGYGQSRSCSPDILEQPSKDAYSLEHPTEPEPLEAPPARKDGKKKKKKPAHTPLSPADYPVEPPPE